MFCAKTKHIFPLEQIVAKLENSLSGRIQKFWSMANEVRDFSPYGKNLRLREPDKNLSSTYVHQMNT